ncbi:hypothetical protein PMAYCL1PPCAC_22726, partial [Pristionchus mayeri]
LPKTVRTRELVLFVESHGSQEGDEISFYGDEKNICQRCNEAKISLDTVITQLRQYSSRTLLIHLACRKGQEIAGDDAEPLDQTMSTKRHKVLCAVKAGWTMIELMPVNPPTVKVL